MDIFYYAEIFPNVEPDFYTLITFKWIIVFMMCMNHIFSSIKLSENFNLMFTNVNFIL